MRKHAERKPRSLMGRLWRWHTKFCPGWKGYQKQITAGEDGESVTLGERTLRLRRAPVEQIIQLRHDVIITGTDRTTDAFDDDTSPTTRHYGAFDGDQCVGCLSLMLTQEGGNSSWRLRGMATPLEMRGQGVGRALIDYVQRDLANTSSVQALWCSARLGAVAFYEKVGWQREGDEYDVPGVGMHVKMIAGEES